MKKLKNISKLINLMNQHYTKIKDVGETTGNLKESDNLERQVTIIIMDTGARIETIMMILVL